MMLDRRKGDRRIIPPLLARPPFAVPERRQGPRRALDRLQEDLLQKLEALAENLAGAPRPVLFEQVLSHTGTYLAHSFQVGDDEVGILLIKDQGQLLRFAYPPELYQGKLNFFPITVPSVAGLVVRAKEGVFHNEMARIPHLHIYERIRLAGRTIRPIQKILAVPLLLADGHVVGVIEVSRKAMILREAGPDFTELDLLKLTDFGRVLATHLIRFLPDDF